MKKIIATLAFVCVVAGGVFGENVTLSSNPELNRYAMFFNNGIGSRTGIWIPPSYTRPVRDEEIYSLVAVLGVNELLLDTVLDFAIVSYYSTMIDRRPKEADAILPANNPKLADQKLGAAVFQEIQILRFLGDTAAVNRHEAVLQFITGRGNATRAEIEKFYRDNVRSLIAAVVDEEFNKVSFLLENRNIRKAHNATLMRNQQNGQYTLSYGGVNTNNETRIVTANSLEALATEMSRRQTDFDQTGIDQVRAQAALIPAVALSDAALSDIKNYLTAFYTTPNATTYNAIKETHIVLTDALLSTSNVRYRVARPAYEITILALNEGLYQRVLADLRASSNISTLTREQQRRLVQLR